MNTTLTITAKITLRREILAHLGARPGDQLVVETLKGGRLQIQTKCGKPAKSIVGLLARSDQKRLSIREIRDEAAAGWAGER